MHLRLSAQAHLFTADCLWLHCLQLSHQTYVHSNNCFKQCLWLFVIRQRLRETEVWICFLWDVGPRPISAGPFQGSRTHALSLCWSFYYYDASPFFLSFQDLKKNKVKMAQTAAAPWLFICKMPGTANQHSPMWTSCQGKVWWAGSRQVTSESGEVWGDVFKMLISSPVFLSLDSRAALQWKFLFISNCLLFNPEQYQLQALPGLLPELPETCRGETSGTVWMFSMQTAKLISDITNGLETAASHMHACTSNRKCRFYSSWKKDKNKSQ